MSASNPTRVVFFGTPDVSVPALNALINDARFEVVTVVTQPPKKVGRKQVLTQSPVHNAADEHGINVLTPNKSKEIFETLQTLAADLHVVVAFGQILPKRLVELPPHGTLNIHPSLLPRWRGAAPVPATILAGDEQTGVCIMLMDEKMDHGPILDVSELPVDGKTTAQLLPELMHLGAERLPNVAAQWVAGTLTPIPQDHEAATFSAMLSRDDAHIDWQQPVERIARQVRAYDPWPGTWTVVETASGPKRLKILAAHIDTSLSGEELRTTEKTTHIGSLVLDRLQLEGRTAVEGAEFAATQPGLVWPIVPLPQEK